jgi:spore germination protein YaaH
MLKLGGDFKCRSSELIPSKHYFIRVRNSDFNYSNNPTFIFQNKEARQLAQSEGLPLEYFSGRLRFDSFSNDPKTYITTIGLYTENNELVAVAKLSVPVLKSFDTETLIKVKLDF